MAEIRLDRVGKRFPDGTVTLKEVNLTIHDGEFFILVGPSGCGKSTLLNLIVGLEEVSSGEIRVDGRVVNGLDPKQRDMAMVFQSYALYPHLSVRGNLAFPLRLAKLPEAEIDRRVAEAAAMLGLTDLLDRKPAGLSGGQRQRVAMGRAMVRQPRAFLLDEPLSNLDAGLRVQMRTEIARLQQRLGATMIYVTHDQTEAMTLGHRIAVLHRGEVQQTGTPQVLYRQPANRFVAGFIGSPGMNFLCARVEGSRVVLPMGSLPWPERFGEEPAEGTRIVAGIRPEHFHSRMAPASSMPGLWFEVEVELVEWLGAEVYLHFMVPGPGGSEPGVAGNRAIARLPGAAAVRRGSKAGLFVPAEDIRLFDHESGRSLERSSSRCDGAGSDGGRLP